MMGKKIAVGLCAVILGWALKFGLNVVTAEPIEFSDDYEGEWIAEQDEWIAEEIAEGIAAPAGGWLDQAAHGTFEANPEQMRELIDRFQAAGAPRVWVVGVEELGRAQLSDTIAVELPSSGYARDRLFEIEAELWGGEGTEDVGQSYLVVSFD